MTPPFSTEAFLDVFEAYNEALWPWASTLWIASLVIILLAWQRPGRAADKALTLLLVWHWAWAAVAYHAMFFTRINPAAAIFAVLFLLQAALFAWTGLRGRLRFDPDGTWRTGAGQLLIAYSLAYPLLVMAGGLTPPRAPTFGVPCPTTALTIGLMLIAPRASWALVIIPILWTAIASSAAVFFGVHADLALAPAAMLLVASRLKRTRGRRSEAALA